MLRGICHRRDTWTLPRHHSTLQCSRRGSAPPAAATPFEVSSEGLPLPCNRSTLLANRRRGQAPRRTSYGGDSSSPPLAGPPPSSRSTLLARWREGHARAPPATPTCLRCRWPRRRPAASCQPLARRRWAGSVLLWRWRLVVTAAGRAAIQQPLDPACAAAQGPGARSFRGCDSWRSGRARAAADISRDR